jgi:hypothetical protein
MIMIDVIISPECCAKRYVRRENQFPFFNLSHHMRRLQFTNSTDNSDIGGCIQKSQMQMIYISQIYNFVVRYQRF